MLASGQFQPKPVGTITSWPATTMPQKGKINNDDDDGVGAQTSNPTYDINLAKEWQVPSGRQTGPRCNLSHEFIPRGLPRATCTAFGGPFHP